MPKTTDSELLRKLREAHEAAKGKGDRGAWAVWSLVAEIVAETADKPTDA
jgi:hypothetical protein